MYAIPALDDFFDNLQAGRWDGDAFPLAAESAERWLLGFASKRDPEKAALAKLSGLSPEKKDIRMILALALALCTPTHHTGPILQAFNRYISKNDAILSRKISEVAHNAQPGHKVDVLEAFRSLLDSSLHGLAGMLYRVPIENILEYAILWDDVDVIKKTLQPERDFDNLSVHRVLAKFPPRPESKVHQAFITSEQAEKDLFLYRMSAVRQQLEFEYTNGISRLWLPESERKVLMPNHRAWLDDHSPSDLMAFPPPHRSDGFAQAVQQDAQRLIRETFRNEQYVPNAKPEHWPLVDDLAQAFLQAGVTPEQLVSYGPCGQKDLVSLHQAIDTLASMDNDKVRFNQVMYRAYLEGYEPKEIIATATSPEQLLGVYRITGDKAYLQAGNDKVRESAMGSDLGL